jgi:FixJ family two-component response regulator
MPGMNGVELQTRLREMQIAYPIIFTSGNAQQADIIDAWHGGARRGCLFEACARGGT